MDLVERLTAVVRRVGLTGRAREYVLEAINNGPSRKVGQFAKNNVVGNYSSVSQGCSIQFESHGAELPFLLRWDYDDEIVGFLDQPPSVEIFKTDKNGRNIRVTYTPDFLVFRETEIRVVEVKRGSELERLAEITPENWEELSGTWCYRPAKEVFDRIGLPFEIANATALSRIETSNLKTLIRVASSAIHIEDAMRFAVLRALEQSAWLTLAELKTQLGLSSYSCLLQLLHERQIFADLRESLLTKPDAVAVASSPEIAIVAAASIVASSGSNDIQVSTQRVPNRKAAARALKNLERVQSNNGRHERRLRARIAEGAANDLTPFQSLIWRYQGNSSGRLAKQVRKFLEEHIQYSIVEKAFRSPSAAHADYRQKAKEFHPNFNPVSQKTYIRYTRQVPSEIRAGHKGGRRLRNAASAASSVLDREIVAVRAFERGCIDHTLLKLFVIVVTSNGEHYVRRPWLTSFVDSHSDYWMSFFLSFNAPSRNSLAMIIRNCVRAYGRVPEYIHSDRGAELKSVYYQSLLAHLGATPDWNPAAHSRFNSQAELINQHIQSKYIASRPGNILDYDNRRKYSKGYRPQDFAVIRLHELFEELAELRDIYNDSIVGVESNAPADRFMTSQGDFPFSGVPVEQDETFLIASSIDLPTSDYKIGPNGDVFIDGLHYSHPELRRLQPKKSHVEIRPDPEDPYKIYCDVGGKWVTALSGRHSVFRCGSASKRWGEAVTVSEGRYVRDFAKERANERIAAAVDQFDRRRPDGDDGNVVDFPLPKNEQSARAAIFSSIRNSELEELDSEDKM